MARLMCDGLEETVACLKAARLEFSPRFLRCKEEAAQLSSQAGFLLAQSARDVFYFSGNIVSEMALFRVGPDEPLIRMMEASRAVAFQLLAALAEPSKSSKGRQALEEARAQRRHVQNLYEAALKGLMNRRNSVDVLKTREIYRSAKLLADGLARSFRPIEEILVQ
ncbi:MAG: hypothetical protein HY548_09060 [Elusimicrobia bacterium]|nr:hypothetical protein [Elusimicrobiota bacterium]